MRVLVVGNLAPSWTSGTSCLTVVEMVVVHEPSYEVEALGIRICRVHEWVVPLVWAPVEGWSDSRVFERRSVLIVLRRET